VLPMSIPRETPSTSAEPNPLDSSSIEVDSKEG
jgi:hypothetical protein